MALQKQPVNINFSMGMDTKTDPYQVPIGKFLNLQNSIFTKAGMLQKRNGYQTLANIPDATASYLTTFSGNLTGIGQNIYAYSSGSNSWVNRGSIQPVFLNTLSMIKNNFNQVQADSVTASNGLTCVGYTEYNGSNNVYKYAILDSTTSQFIVSPMLIPVTTGSVAGSPRIVLLNEYFVILFTVNVSGNYHLQYIAVSSLSPTMPTTAADIDSGYAPTQGLSFDAVTANNTLYVAYNTTSGGQSIKLAVLPKSRVVQGQSPVSPTVFSSQKATVMSMCVDSSGISPIIWAVYYDSSGNTGHALAVDTLGHQVLAPTSIISASGVVNITANASNSVCSFFYEFSNNYSYDSSIPTHYIKKNTITQSGTVGTASVCMRSIGLASKSFIMNNTNYFLSIYYSLYQPTYFLINADSNIIAAKLAYSNAGSYYTYGLPNTTVSNNTIQVSYLFKDLLEAVNKTQGVTTSAGIYAQTGINLSKFTYNQSNLASVEIGNDLNITGGFVWSYDGASPTENGFFVWPDNIEVTTSTSGGSITAQQYFYQVIYEWTDNQGNIFRSAPSVPVTITTTGSSSTNTVNIPTLRLTYKSNVKITVYRWSAANQIYYQVTSINSPLLNDPTTDSVTFTDTFADSDIIGNSIIYTTGGVIENIAPPACNDLALFNNRLWLIDAEDPNLLWYSKQVIEATPVEMSDLLTLYIAPTSGAQGSTGPSTALASMDDKLIIFKRDAIYYINGNGPDNTGSNSTYSEPIFITSAVGCANPQSIVLMPNGLMFQSDKGIWLLGRDLNTMYIGAPVELYNNNIVKSAQTIPGTNQVRFVLDNNITLMYDYFYQQWGTFTNVFAISATLYQGMHTYLNKYAGVYQESPGQYLDGSSPVLMSFTTSWLSLAGLQGFERFYFAYLLGVYYTPFKLNVQLAYDYNPNAIQNIQIAPNNYTSPWGGEAQWGGGQPWGGPGNTFQSRFYPSQQKCETVQITINELYDPSLGVAAGAGLTLSGMNVIIGVKRGHRTQNAGQSFG